MDSVNKKSKIIGIIVFILLICIGFIVFNLSKPKNEEKKDIVDNKYILLDDYSRFFTINSCVYKYIQYLQNQDIESLMLVLDKDYINDNSIDKNNIYNYLPNLTNGMYTFTTKKIYYEKTNSNYITYYVFGYIVEEQMDSAGVKTKYYVKVNLDTKNETFSVAPYDGELFKEDL